MLKFRLFILTVVLTLIADQASKLYIDSTFELFQAVPVIDNFFHITYVRNPGAAFGFLADNSIRLPFFISISVVAIGGILWYLKRIGPDERWQNLALALILSGALGNLIDRIRLGEVIDFLDVHWYNYHWPAFNVADSAICVGVGIMLICSWQEERRNKAA
jgi:signal peptidase II